MKVVFDFRTIDNMDGFYTQFKEKLKVPEHFEGNLDALYDVITGDLDLPLDIEFINMNKKQVKEFDLLIGTMQDAMLDADDFSFGYNLSV